MPYRIETGEGDRPYKIINMETRTQVGSSETFEDAQKSIKHREKAEHDNS